MEPLRQKEEEEGDGTMMITVLDGEEARNDPSRVIDEIGREKIQQIYTMMMLNRILDNKILSLQRQGRLGAFITGTGEEGTSVGSAAATGKEDWMISSYRETGAHLVRGLSVDLMLAQLFGNSNDLLKGRQMSNSWGSRELNNIPTAAPIGAYLPLAVGVAMAAKLRKDKVAVLTFMGDGGTSSSDFHSAMNFAGVFEAPVVFICRNNGWAISLPVSKQTASDTIAVKARAYGFPGVLVDGNDPLAVYLQTKRALEKARRGGGPTFIEALTYRIGPHSTADDPSKYRDMKEVELWEQKDPIARLKRFIVQQELWSESKENELTKSLEQSIALSIERQEKQHPLSAPELLFDDVFAELPLFLKEQRDELSAYLREKSEEK